MIHQYVLISQTSLGKNKFKQIDDMSNKSYFFILDSYDGCRIGIIILMMVKCTAAAHSAIKNILLNFPNDMVFTGRNYFKE